MYTKKIFKISLIVALSVALIYIIVATFFSNDSKMSEFSNFGNTVMPTRVNTKTTSTDKTELALDKILVGLSSGSYKYMKADISLNMKNENGKKALEADLAGVRNIIIRFSATRDGSALATNAGKEQYKADVKAMIKDVYGYDVENVYFRDFVLAQ